MFGDIRSPFSLSGGELDAYLEKGWFRMGQHIFTCNVLNFKRVFYSAIWLRIRLGDYQEDATYRKLKKLNSSFHLAIRPATISSEKEKLFAKYKTSISFDTSSSLVSLLLDNSPTSIFNTYEACIYDQDKLIAVGYFDLGQNSAAGIVSFYDPEYKKHSLGKFLIYSKITFCKEQGLKYFYPGYFAPHYPLFDYKVSIGRSSLEFLNVCINQWQSLSVFPSYAIPIEVIKHKLTTIEDILLSYGIHTARLSYEFYNANNVPHLQGLGLFDYPFFLFVNSENHTDYIPILVYDVVLQKYRLLKCISCFHDDNYTSSDGYYGTHLMKIAEELFAHSDEHAFLSLFLSSMAAHSSL